MGKYDYEYKWDSRYCYTGTFILKNKLDIRNKEDLEKLEREITTLAIAEIRVNPVRGKFDFAHLCSIHRAIFRDIYDWAGKIRSVNIMKGNPFCMCNVIHGYAADLFSKLKADNFLIGRNLDDIRGGLAYYLSEINVLHPFREGNGRTQRVFIEYLAKNAGYNVDFSAVESSEMIEASVLAFDKNYSAMMVMLSRIISPITQKNKKTLYNRSAKGR
ncbi:MAG: Fic family protein [Endomicrobium sp.]|jgi:cell filamentation protein|nr:Fic family protein [Endomicrobium sp.]